VLRPSGPLLFPAADFRGGAGRDGSWQVAGRVAELFSETERHTQHEVILCLVIALPTELNQ